MAGRARQFQRLARRYVGLLHDAEQVAIWILEHNEVGPRSIPPGISPRPQCHQPLNLGVLIRSIEVQVNPTTASRTSIPPLKPQLTSFAFWITSHTPTTLPRLPL